MKKSELLFFSSLRNLCCQILLIPPNRFIGFGDEETDDIVVNGAITTKIKTISEITDDGQFEAFDLDSNVISFIDSCQSSDALSLFTLTDNRIKEIKLAISALDATHIRFHHKDNSVWVNIFDYRCFLYDYRIKKEHPFQVGTLNLSKRSEIDFSFTMNAKSFTKILQQDYSVRIGDNGYAEFSSAEPNSFNFSYLIRGQEVVEPVVEFFNDQLGSNICFVPCANLIPEGHHTTQ
jgi:hypothetical protein